MSPQSCKDLRVWRSCSVSMGTTVRPPRGFSCFGVTMNSALPGQPLLPSDTETCGCLGIILEWSHWKARRGRETLSPKDCGVCKPRSLRPPVSFCYKNKGGQIRWPLRPHLSMWPWASCFSCQLHKRDTPAPHSPCVTRHRSSR